MDTKFCPICTSSLGDALELRARCARTMGVWRAVALSEGTSLGHREIGSCVFSKIWYGRSWGRMRNTHKSWSRSKVVWRVIGRFEKNVKAVSLPMIFQLKWLLMWLSDWAEIWFENISRLEEHAHKISHDLHERFGRCFRPGGVSCTYCGHLALSEGTSLGHMETG